MTQWIDGTGGLFLTETHAAGAATFTLTPSSGFDYPVSFFDGSEAVVPAAGVSLVIPIGATLDTSVGFGFRLWFAIFNNGDGTVSLAVRKCSHGAGTFVSVASPPEYLPLPTTICDVNADNPHVFYTSSTLNATPWMWVAFATYENGLAVAGTWAVSPSSIAQIDKATPRPGATLQHIENEASVSVTLSVNSSVTMNNAIQISPFSKANFVEAGIGSAFIYCQVINTNGTIVLRNTTNAKSIFQIQFFVNAPNGLASSSGRMFDIPNSTATLTYQTVANSINVAGAIQFTVNDIWVREIMA